MAALANRDTYEKDFARKVSRLMQKHRKELARYLGSPPDPSKVPEEFWQKVQKETEEQIFLLLLLIFTAASIQHQPADGFAQFQTEEVERFGQQWSESRSREFGQGYTENTRKRLADYSEKWRASQEADSQDTSQEDLDRLFSPDRAEGIAITETSTAAVAGGEESARVGGYLTDSDIWYTMQDEGVCPVCLPLHKEPRYIWGKRYRNGPPVHPRCRCHIEYVNDPDFETNIARLDAAQPAWFAREVESAKQRVYGRRTPAPRRNQ